MILNRRSDYDLLQLYCDWRMRCEEVHATFTVGWAACPSKSDRWRSRHSTPPLIARGRRPTHTRGRTTVCRQPRE